LGIGVLFRPASRRFIDIHGFGCHATERQNIALVRF
jgi:hypothetical protein